MSFSYLELRFCYQLWKKTRHSLINVILYDHRSPFYQAYLSNISVIFEPMYYEEAGKDEKWIQLMQ